MFDIRGQLRLAATRRSAWQRSKHFGSELEVSELMKYSYTAMKSTEISRGSLVLTWVPASFYTGLRECIALGCMEPPQHRVVLMREEPLGHILAAEANLCCMVHGHVHGRDAGPAALL